MKLAGKDLAYYWSIVKKPLMVYIVVCAMMCAAAVFLKIPELLLAAFALLAVGAFVIPDWVGWSTVKTNGGSVGNAAVAGAFFALVLCCIVLVLSVGMTGLGYILVSGQSEVAGPTATINLLMRRLMEVALMVGLVSFPFYTVGYMAYSAVCGGLFGVIAQMSMKKAQ